MRRAIRCIAVLLLVPIGGAAFAAEPAGQALFRKHCGVCHLKGGTGTFMLGRRLGEQNALLEDRAGLEASYIHAVVRNGIQSMPRVSRVELPDADLARIAQYLSEGSPR